MANKPTVFEEVMEWYFDAFNKSFGSDLHPSTKKNKGAQHGNGKESDRMVEEVEIVQDSYEDEDKKVKQGEELDSPNQYPYGIDKYRCPDLNIPYTPPSYEGSSSSNKVGYTNYGYAKRIIRNPYPKKFKRNDR